MAKCDVSECLKRLADLRTLWADASRPNAEILAIDFDRMASLVQASSKLDDASQAEVPSIASSILKNAAIPRIEVAELDYSALYMYWKIREFHDCLSDLADGSGIIPTANPHDAHISVSKYAKDISLIRENVRSILEEVDKLKDAKGSFGGVGISVLGISVPLKTIIKSARAVFDEVRNPNERINIRDIVLNLSALYQGAKELTVAIGRGMKANFESRLSSAVQISKNAGIALAQSMRIVASEKKMDSIIVSIRRSEGGMDFNFLEWQTKSIPKYVRFLNSGFSSMDFDKKELESVKSEFRKFMFNVEANAGRHMINLSPASMEDDSPEIYVRLGEEYISFSSHDYCRLLFELMTQIARQLQIALREQSKASIDLSRYKGIVTLATDPTFTGGDEID